MVREVKGWFKDEESAHNAYESVLNENKKNY